MKIGLFGYYHANNFGDDLMAVLFAKYLVDEGHEVFVYGISNELADSVGASSIETLTELAKSVDVCVLGGGALLKDVSGSNLTKLQKTLEHECFQLVQITRKRKIPCYAVSIGGNSKSLSRGVRTGIMAYLMSENFKGCTTRLKSDAIFVNNLIKITRGKDLKVNSYPDVVFSMMSVFEPNSIQHQINYIKNSNSYKIAANLHDKHIIYGLHYFVEKNSSIDFIYTHNSIKEKENFIKKYKFTKRSKHVAIDNPIEMLGFLNSVDLVIGYRLHLGIAALSCNTPFLALNAFNKTRMALDELEWGSLYQRINIKKMPRLISSIKRASKGLDSIVNKLPDNLNVIKSESSYHLKWLSGEINSL